MKSIIFSEDKLSVYRRVKMRNIFMCITCFLMLNWSVEAWSFDGSNLVVSGLEGRTSRCPKYEKLSLTKNSGALVGRLVEIFKNPDLVLNVDKFSDLLGLAYDHDRAWFDVNSQETQIRTDILSKKYAQLKSVEYRMPVENDVELERRVVLLVTINVENFCLSRDLINSQFGSGKVFLSSDQRWDGDKSSPWPIGYRFQEAYQEGEGNVAYSPVVLTYYPSGCLANFQIQKRLK